jgi:type I restriction enzyme S subunit
MKQFMATTPMPRLKVKLRTITAKIGSGATPRGGKESYKHDGISLIRSLNVYDFHFEPDGLAYIDENQAEQLSNVEVKAEDILLNITGASVARCCMVPRRILPARVNQHVAIVRVNPSSADPKYVFYVINSPAYKRRLLTLAQGGATREALTKETIEGFEIPLPRIVVQQKIASILSAYDDLIETNTRRIKILKEMARLVYEEWFVKFRFPEHEKVKMVESALGPIPKSWEIKKVGGVIELAYGKALKEEDRRSGSVPVYGSSGIVGYHDKAFVKGPGIVVGRKGNVGSVYWTDADFYPIDTVFFVRTNVCLEYVYYNLQTQNFINNDAAVPGLSRRQAYGLPLLVPDETVLLKFQTIMQSLFPSLRNLRARNDNLRQTRDLLLPKLISGEIDVENLDIKMPAENGLAVAATV